MEEPRKIFKGDNALTEFLVGREPEAARLRLEVWMILALFYARQIGGAVLYSLGNFLTT